jgi:hypothetical protein
VRALLILLVVCVGQMGLVAMTLGRPDLSTAAQLFQDAYPTPAVVVAATAAFVWCLSAATAISLAIQIAHAARGAQARDLRLPGAVAVLLVGILVLGFGASRYYGGGLQLSGGSIEEAREVAR